MFFLQVGFGRPILKSSRAETTATATRTEPEWKVAFCGRRRRTQRAAVRDLSAKKIVGRTKERIRVRDGIMSVCFFSYSAGLLLSIGSRHIQAATEEGPFGTQTENCTSRNSFGSSKKVLSQRVAIPRKWKELQ